MSDGGSSGHRPAVGDYYLWREDDGEIRAGDIGVVVELREDGRMVVDIWGERGERTSFIVGEDDFASNKMAYLAEGAMELTIRIENEVREIEALGRQSAGLRDQLQCLSPHIIVVPEGGLSEKALVPAMASLVETRSAVATIRNDMAKLSLRVKQRQAVVNAYLKLQARRLEALVEAQAADLMVKVGDLSAMVKRAEEAIWTINLYLGKDEEIVQLAKGEPASKDSKIYVRQLVLYADEECAIAADRGGIDFQQLVEFDRWVADPRHRRQVLPEEKGLVAFKVRRKEKDYGGSTSARDVWADAQANALNRKTYFLMANGENLYRICTELEVEDHLVPRETEYEDLFFREEYDWKTHRHEREPIHPGDKRYMEAMEKASALKRHYMRVLLFLQGLLDRTAVFAPLPAPRLNLLNRSVYGEYLVFINDAEKLLGSGRPPFDEWLRGINEKLDIGHRIMGAFERPNSGLRQYRLDHSYGNERLSPSGASYPDSLTLYTIEGREDGSWFFRYGRKDTVFRRGSDDGKPRRRASCKIEPSDDFILNFDEATVADMEFYLGNRTDRHAYEEMFPLLQRAIQLKKEEKEAEAPFRDLLVREIVKAHSTAKTATEVRKQAESEIAGLIDWWKLKNKTHRALLSDDAKALRMIVAEYGQRRQRESDCKEMAGDHASLIEAVRREYPEVVLIAHKKGTSFVALVPHNEENLYVREIVISYTPGERVAQLLHHWELSEWQLVERKQVLSWNILYQAPRWAEWKLDARENEHLTGPEEEKLIWEAETVVMEHLSATYPKERRETDEFAWPPSGDFGRKIEQDNVHRDLVCICRTDDGRYHYWVRVARLKVPDLLLSGDWTDVRLHKVVITWNKKHGVVSFRNTWQGGMYQPHTGKEVAGYWEGNKVLFLDERVLESIFDDLHVRAQAHETLSNLNALVRLATETAKAAMSAILLEKEKARFLAEYWYEELWEDHRKTIKRDVLTPPHPTVVESAAVYLVEHHWRKHHEPVEIKGKTFAALFHMAEALGWPPTEARDDGERELMTFIMDTVITGESSS